MRLPTSHLPTPPEQYTLSTDYSVNERRDGFAVTRAIWFIDRRGEKDVYDDDVSLWPTQADALAEVASLSSVPSHLRVAA